MSDESTACDWPSLSTTRTPMTGSADQAPLASTDVKPFSQDGMNSVGIAPPMTSFDELEVAASGSGSM